eukprot:m.111206 g.111206  ORF g.111206 m.111206 type:complete len:358 (-) comp16998_c0_seq2:478-1551(-)
MDALTVSASKATQIGTVLALFVRDVVGAAVTHYDRTDVAHDGASQDAGEGLLFGLIAVASALTFIGAICASQSEPKQQMSPELQLTQLGEISVTPETTDMESNPLFTIHAAEVIGERDRSGTMHERPPPRRPSAFEMDEDELANTKMAAGVLESHRRATMHLEDAQANKILARNQAKMRMSGKKFDLTSSDPKWLHYGLRKGDAISLLQGYHEQVSGLFLVRAKKPEAGLYALDVLYITNGQSMVEHYLISRTMTGAFEVSGRLLKSGARSLEVVIAELYGSSHIIAGPLTQFVPTATSGARNTGGGSLQGARLSFSARTRRPDDEGEAEAAVQASGSGMGGTSRSFGVDDDDELAC